MTTEVFTFSAQAKVRILDLMEAEGMTPESHFLRAGVKGGGCSGLSYELGFDTRLEEGDTINWVDGIRAVVGKKSLLYLLGTELDFTEGLNGKGFQFVNPNASRTCGCGESFAV